LSDFNPIEQAFSKLKVLLCKATARSIDALWDAIGCIVNTVPAVKCKHDFAHSGYALN